MFCCQPELVLKCENVKRFHEFDLFQAIYTCLLQSVLLWKYSRFTKYKIVGAIKYIETFIISCTAIL